MSGPIHDHGENDGLDFDLSGFEALAEGIRWVIQSGAHLGGAPGTVHETIEHDDV